MIDISKIRLLVKTEETIKIDICKSWDYCQVHYMLFMVAEEPPDQGAIDDIWLRHVPLKVSIFVWRLFRNHLHTKDNLVHQGVIQVGDNVCLTGCELQVTAEHLFFCNFFGGLWHLLRHWLGVFSWYCCCAVWSSGMIPSFFSSLPEVDMVLVRLDNIESNEW